MTEQAITKAPKPVQIHAGNKGISLRNTDEMWQWALYVQQAGITPETLNSPSKIIVAIQYGLEIGLTPMVALNSIAVIGGKPSIYGDVALAMVYKSEMMEYIEETIDGTDEKMVATCTVKRNRQPNPVVRTFSVDQAKQAGLWKKKGTWTTHPDRMLKYKARAFALRDTFPDILEGLHLYEELVGEVDEHLPAPTCETPKRAERKPVDSSVVESPGETITESPETYTEQPETTALESEPADPATLKVMYAGVFNTFTDFVSELNTKMSLGKQQRLFGEFASFALSLSKSDDLPPKEAWTFDMLTTLNDALANGLPEAIREMIPVEKEGDKDAKATESD